MKGIARAGCEELLKIRDSQIREKKIGYYKKVLKHRTQGSRVSLNATQFSPAQVPVWWVHEEKNRQMIVQIKYHNASEAPPFP